MTTDWAERSDHSPLFAVGAILALSAAFLSIARVHVDITVDITVVHFVFVALSALLIIRGVENRLASSR